MEYFVISAKFVPLKYYTFSSQLRRLTSFSVGLFGSANSVTRSYPVMRKSCIEVHNQLIYRFWHHDMIKNIRDKNIITRMHCPLYMQVFTIKNTSLRQDATTVYQAINPIQVDRGRPIKIMPKAHELGFLFVCVWYFLFCFCFCFFPKQMTVVDRTYMWKKSYV